MPPRFCPRRFRRCVCVHEERRKESITCNQDALPILPSLDEELEGCCISKLRTSCMLEVTTSFLGQSLLKNAPAWQSIDPMCQFEVIHFSCGHSSRRLIKHCHFARNDPRHQCFGAWSVKREWTSRHEHCQSCAYQRQRPTMRAA